MDGPRTRPHHSLISPLAAAPNYIDEPSSPCRCRHSFGNRRGAGHLTGFTVIRARQAQTVSSFQAAEGQVWNKRLVCMHAGLPNCAPSHLPRAIRSAPLLGFPVIRRRDSCWMLYRAAPGGHHRPCSSVSASRRCRHWQLASASASSGIAVQSDSVLRPLDFSGLRPTSRGPAWLARGCDQLTTT